MIWKVIRSVYKTELCDSFAYIDKSLEVLIALQFTLSIYEILLIVVPFLLSISEIISVVFPLPRLIHECLSIVISFPLSIYLIPSIVIPFPLSIYLILSIVVSFPLFWAVVLTTQRELAWFVYNLKNFLFITNGYPVLKDPCTHAHLHTHTLLFL